MPGIKADFVHPLESRHVCPLCSLAVKVPMQSDCGHIFCDECLKEKMSDGEIILCPIDEEKILQVAILLNAGVIAVVCYRYSQIMHARGKYRS